MVMVNGLVCCALQMCVVAEWVILFRTPYSPIVDPVTRIHAKRTVLLTRILASDTKNMTLTNENLRVRLLCGSDI